MIFCPKEWCQSSLFNNLIFPMPISIAVLSMLDHSDLLKTRINSQDNRGLAREHILYKFCSVHWQIRHQWQHPWLLLLKSKICLGIKQEIQMIKEALNLLFLCHTGKVLFSGNFSWRRMSIYPFPRQKSVNNNSVCEKKYMRGTIALPKVLMKK